jgi:hypothetical protein
MIWPFLMIYVSETLAVSLAVVTSLMTINSATNLLFSFITKYEKPTCCPNEPGVEIHYPHFSRAKPAEVRIMAKINKATDKPNAFPIMGPIRVPSKMAALEPTVNQAR